MAFRLEKELEGSEQGARLRSVMDMCIDGSGNLLLVSNLHGEQSLSEKRGKPGVATIDSRLAHAEFKPLNLENPWSIHVPDNEPNAHAYIGDRGAGIARGYLLPRFTNSRSKKTPVNDIAVNGPMRIKGPYENMFVLESSPDYGTRLGTVRQITGEGVDDIPGAIDLCSHDDIVYAMIKSHDGFSAVQVGKRPRRMNHPQLGFSESEYRGFAVGRDILLVLYRRKMEKPRVLIIEGRDMEEAELDLAELKSVALGKDGSLYAHGFKAEGKDVRHVVQAYEVK